jgi:hypothetical protein
MLAPELSFPVPSFSAAMHHLSPPVLRLFTLSPERRREAVGIDPDECVQPQASGTMSFTGTQDKCTACDKTVHFIDLLTADGVTYHKTCFKCSHCKGILSVTIARHHVF